MHEEQDIKETIKLLKNVLKEKDAAGKRTEQPKVRSCGLKGLFFKKA